MEDVISMKIDNLQQALLSDQTGKIDLNFVNNLFCECYQEGLEIEAINIFAIYYDVRREYILTDINILQYLSTIFCLPEYSNQYEEICVRIREYFKFKGQI